jgi:hypothetical protein
MYNIFFLPSDLALREWAIPTSKRDGARGKQTRNETLRAHLQPGGKQCSTAYALLGYKMLICVWIQDVEVTCWQRIRTEADSSYIMDAIYYGAHASMTHTSLAHMR